MTALSERVREDGITCSARRRTNPPAFLKHNRTSRWGFTWWDVTLRFEGRQMALPYGLGEGFEGRAPAAERVLQDLLSDAAGFENAGGRFADWVSEYGSDGEPDDAVMFGEIAKTTARLTRLLGSKYSDYVWETEY